MESEKSSSTKIQVINVTETSTRDYDSDDTDDIPTIDTGQFIV